MLGCNGATKGKTHDREALVVSDFFRWNDSLAHARARTRTLLAGDEMNEKTQESRENTGYEHEKRNEMKE